MTPLYSQIRFYRNRARKVIAIFENGHDIEPPFLEDSEIPLATIITTREFLCNIPPSARRPPGDQSFNFPEGVPRKGISNNSQKRNLGPSEMNHANNHEEVGLGTKRWRECDDDERAETRKRSRSTTFTSPVIAFVLGVAVGALNSSVMSRVCI